MVDPLVGPAVRVVPVVDVSGDRDDADSADGDDAGPIAVDDADPPDVDDVATDDGDADDAAVEEPDADAAAAVASSSTSSAASSPVPALENLPQAWCGNWWSRQNCSPQCSQVNSREPLSPQLSHAGM